MAINFLEKNELDNQSVEFTGGKFGVKLKPQGGINKTDEGLSVEFPAPTVDVKLTGLTFNGTTLEATLSDGSTTNVEFSTAIVLEAFKGASDAQKAELVTSLLSALKTELKGEEVQDLSGNTKGYLLKL